MEKRYVKAEKADVAQTGLTGFNNKTHQIAGQN